MKVEVEFEKFLLNMREKAKTPAKSQKDRDSVTFFLNKEIKKFSKSFSTHQMNLELIENGRLIYYRLTLTVKDRFGKHQTVYQLATS